MTKFLLGMFIALCCYAQSISPIQSRGFSIQVPNDSSTGTTLNTLTKIVSGHAIRAFTTDTAVPVYICIYGCGTFGSATLAVGGAFSCQMDAGGATADHFIVNSTATNGRCSDAGPTAPTSGWVIGTVQTGAGANANARIVLFEGYNASSGGGGGPGSGPVTPIAVTAGAATLAFTCASNINTLTIITGTTLTLPTPPTCAPSVSPAAGEFFFQIKNTGPVACPNNIAYAGAANIGLPTCINAQTTGDITTVKMHWDGPNTTWVSDDAVCATCAGLTTGSIFAASGQGVPVAATSANVAATFIGTGCGTTTNVPQLNGDCTAAGGGSALTVAGTADSPLQTTGTATQGPTCTLAAPCYWGFSNKFQGGYKITRVAVSSYSAEATKDGTIFFMDVSCNLVAGTTATTITNTVAPGSGVATTFIEASPPVLTGQFYYIGLTTNCTTCAWTVSGGDDIYVINSQGGSILYAFTGSTAATQGGGPGTAITAPASCGTKTALGSTQENPLVFKIFN